MNFPVVSRPSFWILLLVVFVLTACNDDDPLVIRNDAGSDDEFDIQEERDITEEPDVEEDTGEEDAYGEGCIDDAECDSGVCDIDSGECLDPSCDDGVQNGDETDVDCGGPDCASCDSGSDCNEASDCASGICAEGTCANPSCDDGIQNRDETDVDCGGGICDSCADGLNCIANRDCNSGVCDQSTQTCAAPTCDDGVRNADETGVDCGGPNCDACENGQGCADDSDCTSSVCDEDASVCVAGSCTDGVQNDQETDVDCGGPDCSPCATGRSCSEGSDCLTGYCDSGTCGYAPDCLSILGADPGADDGVYTIDPDGLAGSIAPFQVYCDMTRAGGGWQLISVVQNGDPQVMVANNFCIDESTSTACKGRIHSEQISTDAEVLVLDEGSNDWLIYEGFSATEDSALRYLSRELTLTASSDCNDSDNVCSDQTRDPDLTIKETSGFQVLYDGPLSQWWRYGGWWIGAAPNAGSSSPSGRIHATSYNESHDIRRRTFPQQSTIQQANGHQSIWYRQNSCDDGVLNGNETDVDCGGVCGSCDTGQQCVAGSDCKSGICDGGTCGDVQQDCASIRQASPSTPSGTYTINPSGVGSDDPFDVYCNMAVDGGGWNLAFATREFMATRDDPGVSWQDFDNRSIGDFYNPEMIMEGHAVPDTADDVLWMCDPNGDPSQIRWWSTDMPDQLVDNTHNVGGFSVTTSAKSPNASMTPDTYVEGSTDYPENYYFFITQGGSNACNSSNVGVWGGNCFQQECDSSSGQCNQHRRCDGIETNGNGRFWLFWR